MLELFLHRRVIFKCHPSRDDRGWVTRELFRQGIRLNTPTCFLIGLMTAAAGGTGYVYWSSRGLRAKVVTLSLPYLSYQLASRQEWERYREASTPSPWEQAKGSAAKKCAANTFSHFEPYAGFKGEPHWAQRLGTLLSQRREAWLTHPEQLMPTNRVLGWSLTEISQVYADLLFTLGWLEHQLEEGSRNDGDVSVLKKVVMIEKILDGKPLTFADVNAELDKLKLDGQSLEFVRSGTATTWETLAAGLGLP
jgi:hypothetical protein